MTKPNRTVHHPTRNPDKTGLVRLRGSSRSPKAVRKITGDYHWGFGHAEAFARNVGFENALKLSKKIGPKNLREFKRSIGVEGLSKAFESVGVSGMRTLAEELGPVTSGQLITHFCGKPRLHADREIDIKKVASVTKSIVDLVRTEEWKSRTRPTDFYSSVPWFEIRLRPKA